MVHLSLRYCGITWLGARYLGQSLGDATTGPPNTRLLTLQLAGNHVCDAGVAHLARALRLNTTLLVLNLAGNDIGDAGACQLAEVCSRQCQGREGLQRYVCAGDVSSMYCKLCTGGVC